ncbi:MAG TPA: FAD-binding oxidoreductase [Nitrososphaerales archaeon]
MKNKVASGIIIGGGVTGFSIAYNLAKRGVKITLLEQSYPGYGSSGRCAGGIRSQWSKEHEIVLASESVKILETLSAKLGYNILFRQGGYLILAEDEATLKSLTNDAQIQRRLGVKTEILTKERVKKMLPFIKTSRIVGGTFTRKDGVCHPFALLNGYKYGFKTLEGEILKFTKAEGLVVRGDEVKSVKTREKTIEADFVVVAAGAYSKDLLKTIGINIPSKVFKAEILATEPLRAFLKPMVTCMPSTLYFNQSLKSEVVGGMFEPLNEGYSLESSLEFLRNFSKKIMMIAPSLGHVNILRAWAGLIEFSPDESPIYGETEIDNLYVACADSGKAFTFAPKVGELFAELIIKNRTNPSLSRFSLKRFEKAA